MEMKDKNFRPLVSKKLTNSEEYDKVLLGFPIWYYTAPTIVNTFIEEKKKKKKDIYVSTKDNIVRINQNSETNNKKSNKPFEKFNFN